MDALKCYFCYNNKISFLSDVSNETVRNEIIRRFEGNNDRFNDCYDENGVFLPDNATVRNCPHDGDICAAGKGIHALSYLGRFYVALNHGECLKTNIQTEKNLRYYSHTCISDIQLT